MATKRLKKRRATNNSPCSQDAMRIKPHNVICSESGAAFSLRDNALPHSRPSRRAGDPESAPYLAHLRRVQTAEGYRWTLVNGEVTFENGQPTDATPGTLEKPTDTCDRGIGRIEAPIH